MCSRKKMARRPRPRGRDRPNKDLRRQGVAPSGGVCHDARVGREAGEGEGRAVRSRCGRRDRPAAARGGQVAQTGFRDRVVVIPRTTGDVRASCHLPSRGRAGGMVQLGGTRSRRGTGRPGALRRCLQTLTARAGGGEKSPGPSPPTRQIGNDCRFEGRGPVSEVSAGSARVKSFASKPVKSEIDFGFEGPRRRRRRCETGRPAWRENGNQLPI